MKRSQLRPIRTFVQTAALFAWLGAICAGNACNTPVFRYAMERWDAEPYELTVFHRSPLAAEHTNLLTTFSSTEQPLANLSITFVDLGADLPSRQAQLWQRETNAQPPWLVLRAPGTGADSPPIWSGPLTTAHLKELIESPARRELSRRLLQGESAVWVLLESGQRAEDEKIFALLTNELRKAEATLELPEPAPDDPPLRSSVPLRIDFSVLRVDRRDSAEAMFARLLLHETEALGSANAPMVFPLFGRGRMLAAFPPKDLTPQLIAQVCGFICGSCSCEVKELNPGRDLLLAANWNAVLEGQPAAEPVALPLVGMSQFAAAAATPTTNPPSTALPATAPPPLTEPSHLGRNLVFGFGLVGLVLLIGTIVLRAKARRAGQ